MELTWLGGAAVRLAGRGATLVLDGSVDLGDGRRFARPGEYDVSGVALTGVQTRAGDQMNTVFCAHVDELSVCHLGALSHPLKPEQIEAIGPVDVLVLTADDGPTDAVNALDPRVVVPLFPVDTADPPRNKLSLTRATLPEHRTVVRLDPPRSGRRAASRGLPPLVRDHRRGGDRARGAPSSPGRKEVRGASRP
ncbi:MAG TPA: MBL fold metallo-hydrolase [Chloroflexota bacterium]|nr:MBL fold metallo-hydrolase [Chloroflexota bacterium]